MSKRCQPASVHIRGAGAVAENETVRQSAVPLGLNRNKAPSRGPSRYVQCSRPHAPKPVAYDASHEYTEEKLAYARQNYLENVSLAKKCHERQRAREETNSEWQRVQREKMHDLQSKARGALDADVSAEQRTRISRPLSLDTSSGSRTAHKRLRVEHFYKVSVWPCGDSASEPSLIERAVAEGTPRPKTVDIALIRASVRDGTTLRRDDSNHAKFYMDGTSCDPSMQYSFWNDLVKGITVDDSLRPKILSDGGTGCTRYGVGTYNVVAGFPSESLPQWLPQDVAVRFTRPGICPTTNQYRYDSFNPTVSEMANSMFASANNLGPDVYSMVAFSAQPRGGSLRFCVVSALRRSRNDLNKALLKMESAEEGRRAARKCIELLFRASRLGIAFLDVKPGNILQFLSDTDDQASEFYRLIDFDPAFFIHTEGMDWRALLLMNLALLSAHVYNLNLKDVGKGWAQVVCPVLNELVNRKDEYESKWLFMARCTNIEFDIPSRVAEVDIQRLFVAMSHSYFYGPRSADFRSFEEYEWKNIKRNSKELNDYWRDEKNVTSWPPSWSKPDTEPLIKQLVDLANKSLH